MKEHSQCAFADAILDNTVRCTTEARQRLDAFFVQRDSALLFHRPHSILEFAGVLLARPKGTQAAKHKSEEGVEYT